MESKRPAYERIPAQSSNSFSGLLDDDLRNRLATVGPRARKHVSEGHLTATNIPSYEGLATGSLDQNQIREQYMQEMASLPISTEGGLNAKRLRETELADDYGDTEDDEPESSAPMVDNNQKLYYRPNTHRSMSSQTEDFQDAEFLRPPK